jgi:hypothetical protein
MNKDVMVSGLKINGDNPKNVCEGVSWEATNAFLPF